MEKGKKPKNGRTVGIRTKLIAVIIPIVFMIIVSFFALSRNVIIKLSEENMAASSKVCAGEIYAWKERILAELQIYKDTIENGGFESDDEILTYMKMSADKNTAYPAGLYMGDDSGVYLDASGWVPDDDWVLTERDWYLEGKEHEELAFGEPYYDSKSGDVCVSASVRMNDPSAVRVLSADIYLDYVSEIISKIDEADCRLFLVTKGTKTIVAHSDEKMIAVTLDADGLDSLYANIGSEISKGTSGPLTLKGDSGVYFACINEIPGTDWLLVSYKSRSDVLAALYRLQIVMVLIAAVLCTALIFVTLHLMNRVVKPVARVTDVIQKVSEGDLSQNIEVKGSDEIAVMSNNTQNFLVQMRGTISDIIEIARWLESQSEDNDRVSGSLKDSSRSQSEAMENLTRMADELSGAADHMLEQMEQLVQVIEETNAHGRNVGDMMQQTVKISEAGSAAADQVSSSMKHIEECISSLSDQMTQTDEAVGQIGSMVEMIVSVAEETNLLSLNASIEAARAGAAGKGFAVVADQIGKLAVNSGSAADDISRLTEEIKSAMHQAILKMEESVSEVKASAELVVENRMTFEKVFEKVGETDKKVGQMVGLVGRVENVAAEMQKIAEQQVLDAEQITGSAHVMGEYTRAVSDDSGMVAKNAKELERESKKLMERVSSFRI